MVDRQISARDRVDRSDLTSFEMLDQRVRVDDADVRLRMRGSKVGVTCFRIVKSGAGLLIEDSVAMRTADAASGVVGLALLVVVEP